MINYLVDAYGNMDAARCRQALSSSPVVSEEGRVGWCSGDLSDLGVASAGERHPRESGPSFRADSEKAGSFTRLVSARSPLSYFPQRLGRDGQLRHRFNLHGRCLVPLEDGERCETDQDGGRLLLTTAPPLPFSSQSHYHSST